MTKLQRDIFRLEALYYDASGKLIKITSSIFSEFEVSNSKETAHSLFDVLTSKFKKALHNAASLSLQIGNFNNISATFLICSCFNDICSIAVAVNYRLKQIEGIQDRIQKAIEEIQHKEEEEISYSDIDSVP